MDESHFCSPKVAAQKRVGPTGKELIVVENATSETSLSLTLLLSLENHNSPIFFELREHSNDRWDFFNFIVEAIHNGYIGNGDLLLLDNARIHTAQEIYHLLLDVLESAGAQLVRLPTYSPEFNPTELVFSEVKYYLQRHYISGFPLPPRIVEALHQISYQNLLSYYYRCTTVAQRYI